MCIIAVKPAGKKMFDEKIIRQMFSRNHDGAGFMYYDEAKKTVKISKGFMTVENLLTALNKKDFTNTNLVLHCRIGTSGVMDGLNCHPYPVYSTNKMRCSCKLAVAHNGVLTDYTPEHSSKINDTQIFIKDVLSKLSFGWTEDSEKMLLVKQILKTNKLALLDNTNKITLIGDFIEDNGYYFSNTSYKIYEPKYTALSKKHSLYDDDWSPICCDELNFDYYSVKYFKTKKAMKDFLRPLTVLDEDYYTDDYFFYSVDWDNKAIYKE